MILNILKKSECVNVEILCYYVYVYFISLQRYYHVVRLTLRFTSILLYYNNIIVYSRYLESIKILYGVTNVKLVLKFRDIVESLYHTRSVYSILSIHLLL